MSTFSSIGIVSKINKIQNQFYEIVEMDLTKCTQIRGYKISRIELVSRKAQLTHIQELIYQQQQTNQTPFYRIPITSFI